VGWYDRWGCGTSTPGGESIPGLLKRFTNTGSEGPLQQPLFLLCSRNYLYHRNPPDEEAEEEEEADEDDNVEEDDDKNYKFYGDDNMEEDNNDDKPPPPPPPHIKQVFFKLRNVTLL
jgi:hypothetical protein